MNFRQMETFRAVMLAGSISQAAKQLCRTQPAVSMVISSLEKQIGFQLFERRKKRLYPTPEADYLFKEIDHIFTQINNVSNTLHDFQNKQCGYLRIGSAPGPSYFFIPDLIADFLEDHPKIHISLQTRTSEAVKEWVASEQYNIGIAEISDLDPAVDKEVFDLPCLCALPVDHPLSQREVITPDMLSGVDLITMPPEHSTYRTLKQLFDTNGYQMKVRLQTRFFIPALRFVERGLGICVMDPISVVSYLSYAQSGKIVFRPFSPEINLKLGIIYPANTPQSQITKAFSEQLRSKLLMLKELPHSLQQGA